MIILFHACMSKQSLEVAILNKSLTVPDTALVEFTNNSNTNYILYFYDTRIYYSTKNEVGIMLSNSLNLEIMREGNPIMIYFNLCNYRPLLYETEDEHERQLMLEAESRLQRHLAQIIPAKQKLLLKFPIIDSFVKNGNPNYPILHRSILYEAVLKINSDSTRFWMVGENGEERIQSPSKHYYYNAKPFHGHLESNTVPLRY